MNFVKNDIFRMWILSIMWFSKCEFLPKMRFSKCEFCQKMRFSKCEFLDILRTFAPVGQCVFWLKITLCGAETFSGMVLENQYRIPLTRFSKFLEFLGCHFQTPFFWFSEAKWLECIFSFCTFRSRIYWQPLALSCLNTYGLSPPFPTSTGAMWAAKSSSIFSWWGPIWAPTPWSWLPWTDIRYWRYY